MSVLLSYRATYLYIYIVKSSLNFNRELSLIKSIEENVPVNLWHCCAYKNIYRRTCTALIRQFVNHFKSKYTNFMIYAYVCCTHPEVNAENHSSFRGFKARSNTAVERVALRPSLDSQWSPVWCERDSGCWLNRLDLGRHITNGFLPGLGL
jgi:hypothetical protein